jgi:acetyltransferase-like isoleucine patch superfamily enzyme
LLGRKLTWALVRKAARIPHRTIERVWLELRAACLRIFEGIEGVADLVGRIPGRHAGWMLRRHGAEVGRQTSFVGPVRIQNACGNGFSNLEIGSDCYIGSGALFDLVERIKLADDVVISANVAIFTHADPGDRPLRKHYPRKTGSVLVGQGSWLGAGCIVLPGVRIGRCCMIAAGAVVREDVPDDSVAAGVPARIVKSLTA